MILAFDTSGAYCTACIMDAGGQNLLTTAHEPMTKGQAERLMDLLTEQLQFANLAWSDLTKIAVGTGPGNFTGIRISVAAARGLALGLGIPAVGVSALQAATFGQNTPCYGLVEARGGTCYWQGAHGADPQIVMGQEADIPTDAPVFGAGLGHRPAYPIAQAIARVAAPLSDQPRPKPLYVRQPDAAPPRDLPPKILPDAV
ncbi:tRNA (adenosine(37)-N6)-threonylcarbamoyltransferase complex dimerization subunit type 1 TsaB [Algirhabdus cladophorae]|uniref:tRNA (adenosine(37)-N6)-threonylcarbamoyltransferase complex dimerization subunit type 1 TsaB n=1 Tax=Algirhabdus cladophorae TaxID=3377108 RepID=UPI003B84AE15